MKRLHISAVIITRDDRVRVVALTHQLLTYLSEVVVLVDDRSEEGLIEELNSINGCIAQLNKFSGFGHAKQKVVSLAKNDWVFSLDADEVPNEDCVRSIQQIDLMQPAIYRFKRLNHYCGRPIKGCGWYPDFVIRLFHKDVANFNDASVHESVKAFDAKTPIEALEGEILHYTYGSSLEVLNKVVHYSTLYAENRKGKPKSCLAIVLRAQFAFFKSYILRKGFLYGRDGFVISVMSATAVFNKHWAASEKLRGDIA